MISQAQQGNWTENKNAENILQYYKKELLSLKNGEKIVNKIPLGTRKILIEYGILRKFGPKFEITDHGGNLLQQI